MIKRNVEDSIELLKIWIPKNEPDLIELLEWSEKTIKEIFSMHEKKIINEDTLEMLCEGITETLYNNMRDFTSYYNYIWSN